MREAGLRSRIFTHLTPDRSKNPKTRSLGYTTGNSDNKSI